jgi:hypothetical protein
MQQFAPAQAQTPTFQAQQPIAPGAPYQLYSPGAPSYQAPAAAVAAAPAGVTPTVQNVPTVSYPQPGYTGVYAGYGAAPRVAMAQQAPTGVAETLPLTPPAESVVPGVSDGYAEQPAVDPGAYGGAVQPAPAANGVNGAYGSATAGGAACATCDQPGSMEWALGKHVGCGYWFGGVYGLLMDRDDSNKYALTLAAPTMPSGGYPAPSDAIVLSTRDADIGYQGGVEFRFGRTFGCAPMGPCGGDCGPRWGLEGVYWTIFEDDAYSSYSDNLATRTYTMMPMPGLQYDGDGGGAYRPLNEYWDYAPPASTNDIEVQQARVRSEFEVQNIEVNLLRLSLCGGYGGYGYGPGYGAGAGGALYNAGYGAGCGPGCGVSRFSCTGVCGVRYMQCDESFMYGVDYYNTTTTNSGYLNYWSNAENDLIGFQLGCNGMYRIGCRWGVHMNTLVGLYGNDIDVHQYMVSPTGLVRYTATTESFDAHASKTDVAMIGEFRLGASYQMSPRVRLYGGWRAIGISGIALATDQAPNQFLSAAQGASYVNSNGSMILHGLQTGVEWNY